MEDYEAIELIDSVSESYDQYGSLTDGQLKRASVSSRAFAWDNGKKIRKRSVSLVMSLGRKNRWT
jgi:hypothetical protein